MPRELRERANRACARSEERGVLLQKYPIFYPSPFTVDDMSEFHVQQVVEMKTEKA